MSESKIELKTAIISSKTSNILRRYDTIFSKRLNGIFKRLAGCLRKNLAKGKNITEACHLLKLLIVEKNVKKIKGRT